MPTKEKDQDAALGRDGAYEPPEVEDVETGDGPAVTSAGVDNSNF